MPDGTRHNVNRAPVAAYYFRLTLKSGYNIAYINNGILLQVENFNLVASALETVEPYQESTKSNRDLLMELPFLTTEIQHHFYLKLPLIIKGVTTAIKHHIYSHFSVTSLHTLIQLGS